MTEGQLRWEDRNFISAENLKLATARKPALSSIILVVYPCLNQGKCIPVSTKVNVSKVVYPCLNQGKWVIPLVGLCAGWRSTGPAKNIHQLWRLLTKNTSETCQNQIQRVSCGFSQIHCLWIFGGGLPNQILAFPYSKEYTEKREENPKRKLAGRGGELEASRKYIKKENLPCKA